MAIPEQKTSEPVITAYVDVFTGCAGFDVPPNRESFQLSKPNPTFKELLDAAPSMSQYPDITYAFLLYTVTTTTVNGKVLTEKPKEITPITYIGHVVDLKIVENLPDIYKVVKPCNEDRCNSFVITPPRIVFPLEGNERVISPEGHFIWQRQSKQEPLVASKPNDPRI